MRQVGSIAVVAITLVLSAVTASAEPGATATDDLTRALTALTPYEIAAPIGISDTCAGGGTRATAGTYDPSNGAVNATITLTNCVDNSSTTHNGQVTITGTVAPVAPAGSFSVDVTYVFNTQSTESDESVARACTWRKAGTFDGPTRRFTGTLTKTNCVLTLTDTERRNFVEHLLKRATSHEE